MILHEGDREPRLHNLLSELGNIPSKFFGCSWWTLIDASFFSSVVFSFAHRLRFAATLKKQLLDVHKVEATSTRLVVKSPNFSENLMILFF